MWVSILSLMIGGLLGFFIAGVLAASKRVADLDPDELALSERCDDIIWG